MPLIRLATRSSPLALVQARSVAAGLRAAWPRLRVQVVLAESAADIDLRTPLYAMGGVGVFVKEVQALVLAGRADAGVHSCKDLPTTSPEGLLIGAVLRRDDPRDALVVAAGSADCADLPHGALIGTSSLRRQEQLRRLRADLRFANLRGNVHTRLRKLAAGEADATVMAMAGLQRLRLSLAARATALDPWQACVPAPAQGAIAVDCRSDDARTRTLLAPLAHHATTLAITMERRVLAGIGGGCSLPLGCFAARARDGRWRLRARMWTTQGWFEYDRSGPSDALVADCLAQWQASGLPTAR